MAFRPLYMKDVNLILGEEATGTDFKCQLRGVTLTPDTNITRIKTLCPDGQFAEVDSAEWTLELGYLFGDDDVAPDKALAQYLLANAGDKVPFFFAPRAGGDGFRGTVTLLAGALGGDQGSYSEQSVSLPLDGQPIVWEPTTGGA